MTLAEQLAQWVPQHLASEPRTDDSRLTGVRIPYDYATASRIYAKGEPDARACWPDIGALLRYRHAEDVVIWHDRNRLIDDARD